MRIHPFLTAALALAAMPAAAQSIEGIGPVGDIEKVRGGFQFTEGPAWDGNDSLYFTDIPANRIYRYRPDAEGEKFSVFLEPSGHANGLMVAAAGRVIACQMDGALVSVGADGETKVLTDGYMGKRYNAPNDLVLDRAGGVYFTDPHFRAPEPLPQGKVAVYYLDFEGKVTRLIDDLPAPNGVILSPDEETLYVIPSGQKQMMAYPVESPGKLGEGRVFCELKQKEEGGNGGGDGLTVDTEGNLYITSALGIQVFNPDGGHLGTIAFPEQPANVTFGGTDRKTLYVTARTSLYAAAMEAQGHAFAGRSE